jgi:hypothetical protein
MNLKTPINNSPNEANRATHNAGGSASDPASENAVSAFFGPDRFGDPDWSMVEDRHTRLPDFPIGILTCPWEDWLNRASLGAGVSREHVAVPLLGVASSLLGPSRRVRATRAWIEPLLLWTAIIGKPGDRKTPGLDVILRALDVIDMENRSAIDQQSLTRELRAQIQREQLNSWRAARKAALAADPPREPPPLPSEALAPGKSLVPRAYLSDPSVAGILPHLNKKQHGALIARHELAGLFGGMGKRGQPSRAFLLDAWDGKRFVYERKGVSYEINSLLVGIVGGLQPDKLVRAFGGDDDGLDARFLFAWLSTPEYRPLTDDVLQVDPAFRRALKALQDLLSEDISGIFTQKDVPLSDTGRQEFENFRRFVDSEKRALVGREAQWFAKGELQVLRLAGTLAYLAWSMPQPASMTSLEAITRALEPEAIGADFVTAAIRLWQDYFWPHARAALHQCQLRSMDRHANERRVLTWIKGQRKTEVSREQVRRDCLAQSLNANETMRVLEALEGGNWLRKTATFTRGRPKYRWDVNPELFGEAVAKNQ